MKNRLCRPCDKICRLAVLIGMAVTSPLVAQVVPQFTGIQSTNRETLLRFSGSNGANYRVEVSTDLFTWSPFLTFLTAGVQQHTDSATPFLGVRYYRAYQLTGSNIVTGDLLATDDGDVTIHPVNHASFVMSWNGRTIYNDPVGAASLYQGLPKADLILIGHDHSDHYSTSTITAVQNSNVVIVVPQFIYNLGSFAAYRSNAVVLPNRASTNVLGLTIEGVPAYNSYHPVGNGYNSYVLNIGGKRLYMSGDTGDIPEMRALTNIDVAFVCINRPYTMTVSEATNAVRAFRPKVVYPYHYRDSSQFGNATTNAAYFKQVLGRDLGIEVRLRTWY